MLSLIAEGRSNRAIAKQLYLSPRAVERHVQGIFQKLRPAGHARTTTAACSPCSRCSGTDGKSATRVGGSAVGGLAVARGKLSTRARRDAEGDPHEPRSGSPRDQLRPRRPARRRADGRLLRAAVRRRAGREAAVRRHRPAAAEDDAARRARACCASRCATSTRSSRSCATLGARHVAYGAEPEHYPVVGAGADRLDGRGRRRRLAARVRARMGRRVRRRRRRDARGRGRGELDLAA